MCWGRWRDEKTANASFNFFDVFFLPVKFECDKKEKARINLCNKFILFYKKLFFLRKQKFER